MRKTPSIPWELALFVAVVLAVLGYVSSHIKLIQMPDGHWLFTRTPGRVEWNGRGFRYLVWGVDTVVRVEIDTDGDGDYDLRGDDWQRDPPRWCWQRSGWTWEPVPPARCVEGAGRD
ncbi:hypothetical protein HPC49_39575 [Pyxidicoccus fallax]|uniref:Uncharacterized protein n=1 Tax=Pyxidicoccus fallax TaxID=394095 RepID=A0A848LT45_9BACT|nr:hypothetical protein [Pyxidicoccus fallax]NMO20673.1 hypothetical protein [Pyxidicoccus fallax]NPC84300.1 hypothetical protein [Pyxidicoccus fallax]